MLQQTQVATALPYFERFLTEFPSVSDLAAAKESEVLKLWAGLGYYSRARNLHQGSKIIAERILNGQGFPDSREAWLAIPGVGEYTAGAVSSIAFNQREAIVDGNIERVLSRLNAWKKRDPKKKKAWIHAKALVDEPAAEPRILNQALMELGALICRPKNPKCEACPLTKECKGRESPEKYPEPKPKTIWKHVSEEKWVLTRKKNRRLEIYLVQNLKGVWRQGLWDFPNPLPGKILDEVTLRKEFQSKYVVTNHKISRLHRVFELGSGDLRLGHWFSIQDLPGVPSPVSKVIRKLFF